MHDTQGQYAAFINAMVEPQEPHAWPSQPREAKWARLRIPGAPVTIGLLRDNISLGMFIRGSWNARYVTYHKLLATVEDLVMAVPSSSSRLPS